MHWLVKFPLVTRRQSLQLLKHLIGKQQTVKLNCIVDRVDVRQVPRQSILQQKRPTSGRDEGSSSDEGQAWEEAKVATLG